MSDDMREPDAYDKAVAWLTERPGEIYGAWISPDTHPAGSLFRFCTPTGGPLSGGNCGVNCGCLTTVRSGSVAADSELTRQIRADSRIPCDVEDVIPKNLPVFAEWQRRMDKLWNRPAPVWSEPQAKGTS